MSTNTCRLNDRMIAFLAMPMLWKKLDVTIWNPTNGNISIMPKELYRPATAEDVGLAPQKATFPSNIIKDGEVDKAALKRIGKDENWLSAQLRKEKIGKANDVFLLCADQNGVTFVQRKGE